MAKEHYIFWPKVLLTTDLQLTCYIYILLIIYQFFFTRMERSEKRELSEGEEDNRNPANASNRSARSRSWYSSRTRFILNLGLISPSPRGSGNRPITGSRGSAALIQERNRTETTPISRDSAALIPSSRGIREYGEERNRTETTPFRRDEYERRQTSYNQRSLVEGNIHLVDLSICFNLTDFYQFL